MKYFASCKTLTLDNKYKCYLFAVSFPDKGVGGRDKGADRQPLERRE